MSGEKPAQPTSSTVRSSCELKTDKDYQNDRPFSNDKIALLRSKTTPLNSSKFLKLESDYNDCKAQMQVITSLVTLKLKGQPRTESNLEILQNLTKCLKFFKAKTKDLEEEMERISMIKSEIYPIFELGNDFGDNNSYQWEDIKGIPIFDSNDESCKLSHTWYVLLKLAKLNKWSKT